MATMKRNLDMEQTLYNIQGELIHMYELCQWTLDKYLQQRTERLFGHPYWRKVPTYMRYALRKVERYRTEQMIRDNTYFAYVFDGQTVTFDQWRKDNPEGNAAEVFNTHCERGTFWKSTNKPHHVSKG
jgi:hypothetical protein